MLLLAAQPALAQLDAEWMDLAALYDHRFRFDGDGRPVMTVGLMDGQAEVAVRAATPWRLRFSDGTALRTLALAAGTRVTVKIKEATPARVRRWAVLETLEREDRVRAESLAATWRTRLGAGSAVRVFDVGGIYGVEGTVVDNRARLVAAGPAKEAELEALMQRVYAQLGVRPRVFEELLDLPGARLLLVDDAGVVLAQAKDVVEALAPGAGVTLEKVEHGVGYKSHGVEDRLYASAVVVAVDPRGKLAALNALEVDVLLKGIVPSEIYPTSPLEALKAQAVTARGEVFAKVGVRHLTDPFVLCDEQHCQVYSGVNMEKPACSTAVDQTHGEMAFLGGRLVDSVYSAMCGGRSEDNEVVWEVPAAGALRGRVDHDGADVLLASRAPALELAGRAVAPAPLVADPSRPVAHPGLLLAMDLSGEAAVRQFLVDPPPAYCAQASMGRKDRFRWTRRLPVEEATEKAAELNVGDVTALRVESRGKGGRVRTLLVAGSRGNAFVHRELPVRRLFGNLPSGLFVVDEERGADGALVAFVLRGAGFGHGVGMCQTGAIGMAEAGHDYHAILRHYYNGAEVRRVY